MPTRRLTLKNNSERVEQISSARAHVAYGSVAAHAVALFSNITRRTHFNDGDVGGDALIEREFGGRLDGEGAVGVVEVRVDCLGPADAREAFLVEAAADQTGAQVLGAVFCRPAGVEGVAAAPSPPAARVIPLAHFARARTAPF